MLIALLIALQAAPGIAAPDAADARCISLMNYMITKGTAQQQSAARVGTIYFVGKLRGRNPRVNVTAVLQASAAAATRAKMDAQAEVRRCGEEVTAAANSLRGPTPPAATPRKR
ncbi:MAG TPA: hypothetical protein VM900_11415 [Sphingomonas sp.]|nr:hypothetical protein [Sphingomonas sp.]